MKIAQAVPASSSYVSLPTLLGRRVQEFFFSILSLKSVQASQLFRADSWMQHVIRTGNFALVYGGARSGE